MDEQLAKHNNQIDGLRGIAIIIIVSYHVIDRYQQLYCDTSIRLMNFWGTLGVTIFLMISSYFMVDVKADRLFLVEGVKKFILKIIRLWPTYFICITITFIITRFIELPDRTVTISDFIANIFWINRFVKMDYVDGAHWYLGVLLTAYFIVIIFKCWGGGDTEKSYSLWDMAVLGIINGYSTANRRNISSWQTICWMYLYWNCN